MCSKHFFAKIGQSGKNKHYNQNEFNLMPKVYLVIKIVGMIRKYHNHKQQTTPWHREEEPLLKTGTCNLLHLNIWLCFLKKFFCTK